MRPAYAVFLLSCAPAESDTGENESGAVTIEIVSPEHGDSFEQGDSIHFEVSAKQGKESAKITSAVWTVGEDTFRGDSTDYGRLDNGNYTVKVEVVVGEKTYRDDVGIQVQGGGDADTDVDADSDTDTDVDTDMPYAGSLSSHIWLEGDFSYDADCNGTVTLTYTAASTLIGTGNCKLDGDYDMEYRIDGTASKGSLAGNMIMTNEGTEYATPFTGTGRQGEALSASFDKTYRDGGDSLRIQGTWTANPL